MPAKKVLVLGATGFTGRHAVHYFQQEGYHVFGTTRTKDHPHLIHLDMTDREKIFQLIKSLHCDYILNLVGQNMVTRSWESPLTTVDVNFTATLHLLEACRMYQPNTKIIIIGSALEDDKQTIHPYGISKSLQSQLAKHWAHLFNLKIVMVRLTNLIGPGFSTGVCSSFAKQIVKLEKNCCENRKLSIMNREIKRDFLDVRDAVRAYELLLKKGQSKTVYEVGTGKSISLIHVVETLRELTDYPFLVDIQERPTQIETIKLNINKLSNLGWKPTYSLRQSLLDSLNFYRQTICCMGEDPDGESFNHHSSL